MRRLLQFVYVAMLLTACTPHFEVPRMTPDEARKVDQLTERMTTRCVGRYLIDLPDQFVLSALNPAEVDELPVTVTPMSRAVFDAQLAARIQELEKEHMDGKPHRPLLKGHEKTPDGFIGRVFNRVESGGTAEFARILELVAWKEGFQIETRTKATDGTDLEIDKSILGTVWEPIQRRIIDEYKNTNDTPQQLARLLALYDRTVGRKETETPTGQGLCIPNGFIQGEPAVEEGLSTTFDLHGAPDVSLRFSHLGDLHEEKSLLQRSRQVEKEMATSGTQTIRKGVKEIHGLPYEEWLMHGMTLDRVMGTMFALHGNEVAEGADKPFIKVELLNGFRITPRPDLTDQEKERLGLYKELSGATLSPAQAVSLWDRIIPTLRRRPGAF